jgi:alginate O-acetyltransferase complex protein AlgI
MLFNSYAFLLAFLPAALFIYWFADNSDRWRNWVLIALSLAFYSYWDVRFLPVIAGSILINWWAAAVYIRTERPSVITAAIVANLVALGIFKYADFFAGNLAAVLGRVAPDFQIALPLGISFFTFHHIMYLVDLRRGRAPAYPLERYALYICFFPQALAGPIARWNEVIHQFGRRAFAPGWQPRFAMGVTFIVVGLLQKVFLGDTLGDAVQRIYATAQIDPVLDGSAWIGVVGFPFQVFFDFSGYSDIAIGLALLFAIQLPLNFDGPFRASSLQQFWRRWHMTLMRFLRDYVYIPLGGNRHGASRQVAAIFVTMALAGFWHGAGWNFVLWGLLHGIGLSVAIFWSTVFPPMPKLAGWALTVAFFILTLNVFRAGSLEICIRMYEGLLVVPRFDHNGVRALFIAILVAIALPPTHVICERLVSAPRSITAVALALAFVAVLVGLGDQGNYEFVYFQF